MYADQDGMSSNVEQLIAQLSADVRPVSRHALVQRLVLGVSGGGLITAALVVMTLGIRPDLDTAVHAFPFWMKWSYTLSLALVALYAVTQLARPSLSAERSLWLVLMPVLILAGIGVDELVRTPSSAWPAMWLGRSWKSCPWLVLTLASPIFIGLLWSFRKLAPTRLRAAGATAGLCAGAWAATIYCLHCPEVSAIFVLTWYSLGMVLAAAIGAILGPRLLRW